MGQWQSECWENYNFCQVTLVGGGNLVGDTERGHTSSNVFQSSNFLAICCE